MRAQARIVAVADPVRGTRLAAMRGEPPLLPRRTFPSDSEGEVQLHLVGGAAGPLGGDDLRIEIEVGPDARLCVRSVAASLALPGPAGGQSRLHITARVAAGGRLRWLPEPLIGAAGCDHRTVTSIALAEGATLLWREELVCGRYAEPVGDVRIETTLRYGGRTLLRNDLAVGPRASGWSGPAVLDGARAVGSLLVVDPAWSDATSQEPTRCVWMAGPDDGSGRPDSAGGPTGVRRAAPEHSTAAVLPLAGGPAMLVNAVGADPRAVRARLDRLSVRRYVPERTARFRAIPIARVSPAASSATAGDAE
ncbi:urease accessory protein UreD [Plantactinospora sp. S1510]|uniref:Urease accessory protein UreD n=1 Tax=Plantactinospora alkalitolerans TaxID=2789879 RepID=A0ABS0H2H0_9ACTN|nr:urease accessory protein UreD [Plantactinospora alkalitolerans]MBF9132660.1 urease accessory protein UreD [Plantactinospora alkalitolerans]